jgi:hypothetical protein
VGTEARPVVTGVLGVVNIFVAIWAGVLLWLFAGWHVDDGVAARMSDGDWWIGGAFRVGVSLTVAVVLGFVSRALSWAAVRAFGPLPQLAEQPLAVGVALIAFAGGAVGTVQFVVSHPMF